MRSESLACDERPEDTAAEKARRLLLDIFGYHEFRGDQAEIIDQLIGGNDALVLMPTGGGKSLCYQIPALVRGGLGVVISPLISLMQDQVDALLQLGLRAAYLNSSLDPNQARAIEQKVRQKELDLLYVAPERALTERFLSLLEGASVALFAIDEAHCVSQWGHDFRPEYRQLSILHERFPAIPRAALTATADQITRAEIVQQLKLRRPRIFVASFDRPNIRYRVVEKRAGTSQVLKFMNEPGRGGQSGILYCNTRKKVEETAALLAEAGFPALPYHGGMDQDVRRRHQMRFLREEGLVMTATIAFGMGIDKPDVRYVAHLDLPQSLECYYQETGRAGRDGEPAEAWMTYNLGDVVQLAQRIDEAEIPDLQRRVRRQKLEAMLGFCETVQCRRSVMLRYFDEIAPPCGNCDVCLEPPETWDGTVAVQKLLSAALRTGQHFGAGYLIDLLLGKSSPRMAQLGHDRLPTFGVGKELRERDWRAVVRQTVAAGFLNPNAGHYGALEVTEKARAVLKGETAISLRRVLEQMPKQRAQRPKEAELPPSDQALLAALRQSRKNIALAQGVPAYVIFNDQTMREIAYLKPDTFAALRMVNGIGERKLARYGQQIIEIVMRHKKAPA